MAAKGKLSQKEFSITSLNEFIDLVDAIGSTGILILAMFVSCGSEGSSANIGNLYRHLSELAVWIVKPRMTLGRNSPLVRLPSASLSRCLQMTGISIF